MCEWTFILPTEQYDAFVKFTHDQLMRRFGEQPASCEYISLNDLQLVNGSLSIIHRLFVKFEVNHIYVCCLRIHLSRYKQCIYLSSTDVSWVSAATIDDANCCWLLQELWVRLDFSLAVPRRLYVDSVCGIHICSTESGGLPAANLFKDSMWLHQWPLNNIYLALFWCLRKRLTATTQPGL